MRTFIAVKLPRFQRIDELMGLLRSSGSDLKLVEPENLHLTLVFIGELPQTELESVIEAMGQLKFKRFKVRLRGMGAFPSMNRPRVIWVGVEDGKVELQALRTRLMAELRRRHVRPEDEKEFSPHLTLARVKGPFNAQNLFKVLMDNLNVEVGEFEVSKVTLFRSDLRPSGPIYTEISEVRALEPQ